VRVVGVHHHDDVLVAGQRHGHPEPVPDRRAEPLVDLVSLHLDRHVARVVGGDPGGRVPAAVIDHDDLVREAVLVHRLVETPQQHAEALLLVVGGQHHQHASRRRSPRRRFRARSARR